MLNELKNIPEYKGKGKVLRVKEGYNPNSSSLGSIVFSFPVALLAVPIVLSTAAALIAVKFTTNSEKESEEKNEEQEKK